MKKILFILLCIFTTAFVFTSCKDEGNDYLVSYGIGENEQHFSGTPEEVDSLSEMAFHIMETVDNIYRLLATKLIQVL